jgi:formylglycine-generating enzyme required for sulfatase activity
MLSLYALYWCLPAGSCRDWHAGAFLAKAKNVGPENTTRATFRVLRGESLSSSAKYCRSGNRGGNNRGHKLFHAGFRVSVAAGGVD